ncbi:uncharacterized protein C8orf48-like [Hypanus sabinus]|uniref:uncharacterized protein C8orf48-like n=1 Tax=Hypanus sabinus TaxID=79690 RepID=UPI0028C50081|nr:uncharacterized protein C8orf48-like [Hypanus sabinus]XP_059832958.1 uncharacterized protein C8orf48-like [Hypanus sabinus]XP_059832959.1 uncharacterized protein C8orf48-like [Hypanus sabinus]XP_059832961.1 uncharacterized protein C8orf48-like [Hypanus sabinus]
MSKGQAVVQNPSDSSETCSSCMNGVLQYSDESLATYSGENEESLESYSQSFESYQSFHEDFEQETESEISAIKSELEFMSPQSFKEEIKEELVCYEDSEDLLAKEKFIEKLLGVLNSNRFVSTSYYQKKKCTESCGESIQPILIESAPVQKYCSMKIDQIQQRIQQEQSEPNKYGMQHLTKPLGRETAPQQNCIVPQHLINRVRLKYITETVKQIVQTNVHQPSRCAACLKEISKLAEHNFFRVKQIQLEEASLQEKIEEHIYTKDGITLIGEIHSSLPKYSDAASLVWKRLFDKINLK